MNWSAEQWTDLCCALGTNNCTMMMMMIITTAVISYGNRFSNCCWFVVGKWLFFYSFSAQYFSLSFSISVLYCSGITIARWNQTKRSLCRRIKNKTKQFFFCICSIGREMFSLSLLKKIKIQKHPSLWK